MNLSQLKSEKLDKNVLSFKKILKIKGMKKKLWLLDSTIENHIYNNYCILIDIKLIKGFL